MFSGFESFLYLGVFVLIFLVEHSFVIITFALTHLFPYFLYICAICEFDIKKRRLWFTYYL